MKRFLIFLCPCFVLALSFFSYADEVKPNKASEEKNTPSPFLLSEQKTSLLQGKWMMSLPEGASVSPTNDENGDTSNLEKTEISWTDGVGKYQLIVREKFLFADDQFMQYVQTMMKRQNQDYKAEELKRSDSFKVFLVASSDLLLGKDIASVEVPVYALLVAPDRTISLFQLMSDKKGNIAKASEFYSWMKAMLQSLTYGKPAWSSAAQYHKIRVGFIDALKLYLPSGFVKTCQNGPDFKVYRFQQLGLFQTFASSIGLYFGHAGNYQYRQRQNQDAALKIQKIKGRLLGQKIIWHEYQKKEAGIDGDVLMFYQEAMFTVPKNFVYPSSESFQIHVFLKAASLSEMLKIKGLVNHLQLR